MYGNKGSWYNIKFNYNSNTDKKYSVYNKYCELLKKNLINNLFTCFFLCSKKNKNIYDHKLVSWFKKFNIFNCTWS